jgi:diguanylate cyclase (GGDEF)-like protein
VHNLISLKKYLDLIPANVDADDQGLNGAKKQLAAAQSKENHPELNPLAKVILDCYRSALLAMGDSGVKGCPNVGSTLQQSLTSLERRLSATISAPHVTETEALVEESLQQWGEGSAQYLKAKANEVKELLIMLARTAESIGERDQRYTKQFQQITSQLQTIANLEDLTQIRASLVKQTTELKACVEQMVDDSKKSVASLQAEVTTYESKLKAAEQLAQQDPLTGLANRRSVEERIQWRIEHEQVFCVVMVDLNDFKQVNDTYGHLAGDDLLKQFSQELRSNIRSTDIVGRWGGDEFIVVLDSDLATAATQIERVKKWALGEYTVQSAAGAAKTKVRVGASIGVALWQKPQTMQELIGSADAAMYQEKEQG